MSINLAKIWNIVGLICTIIVAIGAIVGIWAFVVKPTAKLSAVVEYSDIQWPYTIVELAYRLDELSEVDNICKAITDSNTTPENVNLAEEFSKYLKDGLREFQRPGGLITHEGAYSIRVVNEGRKVCTGVSVKLPGAWLVTLWREDDTRNILKDCSVVSIGDLKPQEGVFLMAWSLWKADEYYAKQIRVSHDLGVASMHIRRPVGRFAQWVDKHLFLIGFLCFGTLWSIAVVIYQMHIKPWLEKNEKEKKHIEAQPTMVS